MKNSQFQEMDRRTFLKTSGAIGAAIAMGTTGTASTQAEATAGAKVSEEKIDMYCHILTPKFKEAVFKIIPKTSYEWEAHSTRPALFELNLRLKAMDQTPGLRELLTPTPAPLESLAPPKQAVDIAKMANDEMAELVAKYPDRFVAGVACLPLNDMDASLREAERAVKDLKLKGIQMCSSINGKPLDSPQFLGLYEEMTQYDLPIWIHPTKARDIPDYPGEEMSKYALFLAFAWPYETTLAMARLVFSGVLEKYPNLKFITHHCGGMIPSFHKRLNSIPREAMSGGLTPLTRPPVEYFKKFYADTVMGGNVPGLMAGYAFFGGDNMLFGSDYPYPGGPTHGDTALREVIKSVEMMNISDEDKAKIFSKNARRILKLTQ